MCRARLQSHEPVAGPLRGELRDFDPRLDGKLLLEDDLQGAPLGVNVQNQRRGELRRVLQLAFYVEEHESPGSKARTHYVLS